MTLAFLPASAENQIDAKQMTVTVSRAREQLRIYTDSTAVLREAATRSGDRESATEHTRQAQGKQRQNEQAIEPDLQEHVIRNSKPVTYDPETDRYEKALRQKLSQKYPSLSAVQAARLEKEIQKAVIKHQKIVQRDAAHEQHHPPAPPKPKHDQTQERGMSMGF